MNVDVIVCGSLNMDLVARVAALPRPGETVPGRELRRLPGGKGLNQAVAAARMGARTAMLGACANDADGDTLRTLLRAEGIDTGFVALRDIDRSPGTHTGLAMVCVGDDGENAIVVHAGANATVTPEDARLAVQAVRGMAKVAVVQLETPIETVAAFLAAARAAGMRTLLNTAPALPGSRPLLALADIVVLNETELAYYSGDGHDSNDDGIDHSKPLETYANLARRLVTESVPNVPSTHERPSATISRQTIVVTLGARGALTVCGEIVEHHPAPQVTPVDTTGAGDCFCGVLAAGLAAELPLPTAVQRANRAAALAVGRVGAAPSMPLAAELGAP